MFSTCQIITCAMFKAKLIDGWSRRAYPIERV
jgi:hypothetical protein